MWQSLLKTAAKYQAEVYKHADYDLGTTEFSLTMDDIPDFKRDDSLPFYVLSIRGSDEFMDWIKNFDLRQTDGWKKAAYDAACEILDHKEIEDAFSSDLPVLITGHSKAGPTALRLKYLFPQNDIYCVAFAPARSISNNVDIRLDNTLLIKDPDDIVPLVGWSRFKHPECDVIDLADDKIISFKDHGINHFLEYVDSL